MKKHVAIVGAGIAGLTLAYECLKKGFLVTIVEGANRIAAEGSSHERAVTFPTLSAIPTVLSDISLRGRLQLDLLLKELKAPYQQPGLLKLAMNDREEKRWQRALTSHQLAAPAYQQLTADQTEKKLGLRCSRGSLWLPWVKMLSLRDLCQRLLAHIETEIEMHLSWKLQEFAESTDEVVIANEQGQSLRADMVVLTCPSYLRRRVELREIQGRIIEIFLADNRFDFPFIVNFKRHLSPKDSQGYHSLGATFERVVYPDERGHTDRPTQADRNELRRTKDDGSELASDETAALELIQDLKEFFACPDLTVHVQKIWTRSRWTRAGQIPLCETLLHHRRVFAFSGFGAKASLAVPGLTDKMLANLSLL